MICCGVSCWLTGWSMSWKVWLIAESSLSTGLSMSCSALRTSGLYSCVELESTVILALGANWLRMLIVSCMICRNCGCRVGSPFPEKVMTSMGVLSACSVSRSCCLTCCGVGSCGLLTGVLYPHSQ